MENFNLKKFLVENKLTTNSRAINEYIEDEGPVVNAFKKAGITGRVDLTVYEGRDTDHVKSLSVQQAIEYIEDLSENGELSRTYFYDDIEENGALLNIQLDDTIAIDVFKSNPENYG